MYSRQLVRYWGRKPIEVIDGLINEDNHVIVDPFGGSGSVVLEALRKGKRAVYADINPYAWLIAHVQIAGADPAEFNSVAGRAVRRARDIEGLIRRRTLPNDWLRYSDGAPFVKRRNFDRVSQFFPRENFRKLLALLRAIDETTASVNTKLALYLAFASSLYPSSLMKRRESGSWGVPSYWAPQDNSPVDAYEAFSRSVKRIHDFLRKGRFYSVCYTDLCDADARLLLSNALSVEYHRDYTLITDPPFTDEIQYMELSFFYWAWLRVSALPKIMASLVGRKMAFRFADELVINENRGLDVNVYINRFRRFLMRTKHVRRKVLIFHEENAGLLNVIREAIGEVWGQFEEKRFTLDIHRRVGPRGGNTYVVFIAEQA